MLSTRENEGDKASEPNRSIEEIEASWQEEIEAARREGEAEAAERDEIRARAIAFDVELAEALRTNDRERALSVIDAAQENSKALDLFIKRSIERRDRLKLMIEKKEQKLNE